MSPPPPLARRSFDLADGRRFAELSGDRNPLHLDPTFARRSLIGQPVVHGVHLAAWALDAWLASRAPPPAPAVLEARFSQPTYLDEPVELRVRQDTPGEAVLVVGPPGIEAAEVRLATGPGRPPPALQPGSLPPEVEALPATARDLDLEAVATDRGRVTLPEVAGTTEALAQAFPALAAAWGAGAALRLASLSALVGMRCPGRRALFLSLRVLDPGRPWTGELGFRVRRARAATRLVDLACDAGGAPASLRALVLPEPVTQPSYAALATRVPGGRFRGRRTLVVGGSRGLGEVCAKLLAAGGGAPALTYRRGADDAARVVAEIEAGGGQARAQALDVRDPQPALRALAAQGWTPTALAYFATPPLHTRRSDRLQPGDLEALLDVYLVGLLATLGACRAVTDDPLEVLVPSTQLLDPSPPSGRGPDGLAAYRLAKAASEDLARRLTATCPGVRVRCPRLPRVATDQGRGLLEAPGTDPFDALASALEL